MKNHRILTCAITLSSIIALRLAADTAPPPATQPTPLTIPLWEKDMPNAATHPAPERDDGTGRIWNVSVPSMLVYLPTDHAHAPHMAIVFCPGGGYTHLTRLEGADGFVQTFLPRGVAVISLKYRLTPASSDVERDARNDAIRAIRIIRQHASEWNIDPHRIVLAGASAGANLTLNLASHPANTDPEAHDPIDQQNGNPDYVCMLSPWPDSHPISTYPIGKDAPPAFIATAKDDYTAPPAFAEALAAAYQTAGVNREFFIVDTGGHGAFTTGGPGDGGKWVDHFWPWITQQTQHRRPNP